MLLNRALTALGARCAPMSARSVTLGRISLPLSAMRSTASHRSLRLVTHHQLVSRSAAIRSPSDLTSSSTFLVPVPATRLLSTDSSQHGPSEDQRTETNRKWGPAAGFIISGGALILAKGKWILGALKFTKLATMGSMILSSFAYSFIFGWPYAIGMVGMLLVHESGHALVMIRQGIPTGPMVFIPFMGAVVSMKGMPEDVYREAQVALGGPALGSLGAVVVAVAGATTDSQLLMALGDFGLMINLFNLLPIGMLDGGRIAGAISKYILVAGMAGGVGLVAMGLIHNPIFYIILLAGGWTTYQRFFGVDELPPSYYAIPPAQRITITLMYLGLIAALLVAMQVNNLRRKSPKQLETELQLPRSQLSKWGDEFVEDDPWAPDEV